MNNLISYSLNMKIRNYLNYIVPVELAKKLKNVYGR